jgi:hypothetical protein
MIAPQDAERLADRDNATGVAQEGLSHRIHADDRQHAPVRCGDGALLQSLMIQFHCATCDGAKMIGSRVGHPAYAKRRGAFGQGFW